MVATLRQLQDPTSRSPAAEMFDEALVVSVGTIDELVGALDRDATVEEIENESDQA